MTILAMTLPLARRNPIQIPRRDLSLINSDDLTLHITVVASDVPDAEALTLSGASTSVRMLVWYVANGWDYGPPYPTSRAVLWSDTATVAGDTPTRADILFPAGTVTDEPRWRQRLGYTVQLDYADDISTLAWGVLRLQYAENVPWG